MSEPEQTGSYVEPGSEYVRDMAYIGDRITAEPGRSRDPHGHDKAPAEITTPTWPVEPGRYRLVAAKGVPVGEPRHHRARPARPR